MNRVHGPAEIDARNGLNASCGSKNSDHFTRWVSFLFLFFAFPESGWAASLNLPPVILPNGGKTNAAAYRLVWPTAPGIRYEPQQSFDLRLWTTLGGYPAQAPGLAEQYLFNAETNRLFFRVLQLDEQPPAIVARDPEAGSFGVRRFARVAIGLEDQSEISPASIRLTVGTLGTFTTTSTRLTFTNNALVFNNGEDTALGAYGEKVNLSLIAADVLGNLATNTWSFDLEVQPEVVTNLFVFGSAQAERTGQRVAPSPMAAVASRLNGSAHLSGNGQSWTLSQVAADRIVIAYTDSTAPPIRPGTFVCNQAPANLHEIFYRQVTSANDDAANKRLTIFTTDAPLERFVQSGSLAISGNSRVIEFVSGGNFAKAIAIGGEVAFPRIGFSLDGTEFKLTNSDGFDLAKLTAKELHWWLTPRLSSALEISSGKLERFEAIASGNISTAMILELDVLVLGVRREYLLYDLPEQLEPRYWMYLGNIGPIPVFASLSFDLQISVTPEAKALLHFNYGLRQDIDMAFGLRYQASRVDWIKAFKIAPAEIEPFTASIAGELSLEVAVKPKLEFLVYGLAGLSAGITPSSKIVFAASTKEPLSGRLEAKVALDLGVSGPALEFLNPKPELSLPLWQDEWLLFPKPAAISIQTQPRSLEVKEGESAYFTCSATASTTLAYQWYHRGVPLPHQTSRTLLLPGVTIGHAGDYFVRLNAGAESKDSDLARLTVNSVSTGPIPAGMALIPAGSFQMGDTFSEGNSNERPVHSVVVSAFYMDKYEVTKALWDEVKGWSGGNGYGFDDPGAGKAANHPVQLVNWYDMVKWCNARSQKEGRVSAYYTDSAMTQVYKTGRVAPYVKWAAGYRLPTEAEWEKAARGGATGYRFPRSDADTITHSRANYYSSSSYSYDVSPTRGYHPTYAAGGGPYTSPVGSFAPNGYGLYDMAGNVSEWCWDWYGSSSYSNGSQTDPRGPASGPLRVSRGGGWNNFGAVYCRSASRERWNPDGRSDGIGFRCVLGPRQP